MHLVINIQNSKSERYSHRDDATSTYILIRIYNDRFKLDGKKSYGYGDGGRKILSYYLGKLIFT